MKKCQYCQVLLDQQFQRCPLCGNNLETKKEGGRLYPIYATEEKSNKWGLYRKIGLLLSIVILSLCMVVNIVHWERNVWFLYMFVYLVYGWFLIENLLLSSMQLRGKIILQLIGFASMISMIDIMDGAIGWSIDYVVPLLLVAAISIIIPVAYIRRKVWKDFMFYPFYSLLIAIILIVLFLLNLSTVLWPSITAFSSSMLTLVIMVICCGKKYQMELKKCFHI